MVEVASFGLDVDRLATEGWYRIVGGGRRERKKMGADEEQPSKNTKLRGFIFRAKIWIG